ncbi:M20/M25/M40 family metallo-hydrolase [Nonomuraea sp. K274]|uniref:M20/M25/M40 family metallo-hydrolase n=1 Tax=Nonomuraea cypriaca TaxID=1187855 RepID=A0A931A3A1_9ACTN|nr:M20/M25/M40 family metallo-hydrolase [Nonomuraea cypriaca]MBF8184215.1 M20/M25/M40 family metallo-hydrolase [Nonomuraea cypriaca]
MSEFDGRVAAALEADRDLYESWLVELCAQRSISAAADGVGECADLVERMCMDVGLTVERVETPRHPVMIATIAGDSDYTLGLYDHYDVQPVDPLTEWTSDPFVPTARDGRLFARGIADNKGNLVTRLAAVHAWLRAAGSLPVNVCFIIEGDEEIGSPGLNAVADVVRSKLSLDGLIWESGSVNAAGELVSYEGVKGVLGLELVATAPRGDLHSMYATVVPNPVWRLVRALASMRDADGEPVVDGLSAGAEPLSDQDRRELKGYHANEAATLRRMGARTDLGDEELVRRHVFGTTLNLSGLSAGYVGSGTKTVLPATASARMDIRLVPNQDPTVIAEAIRDHLTRTGFDDIAVKVLNAVPPYRGSAGGIADAVRMVADELYEGFVGYPMIPGAGPMRAICGDSDLPVSAGPAVGDHLSNIHAPNESIRLDNFHRAALGIAKLMPLLRK